MAPTKVGSGASEPEGTAGGCTQLINDVLYVMRAGLPRGGGELLSLQGSSTGVAPGRVKVVCLELLLKSQRKAGFSSPAGLAGFSSTCEPDEEPVQTSRGQQT